MLFDPPKGKIVVFTAPSGSGKTTVVRHLLKKYDILGFSVSATTRKKREGEVEGVHYYFMSENEFKEKINNGEFVEYEEVYPGKYYGTMKSEIERLWGKGKIILFDIDVKGAINIQDEYRKVCSSVFIRVPSLQILEQRLIARGKDSSEAILERIAKARYELSFENRFDHVIVNDLLEVALEEAEQIVEKLIEESHG